MTATDYNIFDGTDALAWDPKGIHYRNKSFRAHVIRSIHVEKFLILFRLKIYENPNRDLPRSNVLYPGLKFFN